MTEPSKVFLEPGDKPAQNPPPGYIASYHKPDGPYYTDDGGVETKILTEKVIDLPAPVVSGLTTAAVGDLVTFTVDNYDSENTYIAVFDGASVDVVAGTINFTMPAVYSEGSKCLVVHASRSGYAAVTGVAVIKITPDEIISAYADAETSFSLMNPGDKAGEYNFQAWGIGVPAGGPAFSASGEKVFIGDFQTGYLHLGLLGTPWDLSTLSYSGSHDTGLGADILRAFTFTPSGDKLYLSGESGSITEIGLTVAWDLSTIGTPVALDTGRSRVYGLAMEENYLWAIDPSLSRLLRIPLFGSDISETVISTIETFAIPNDITLPWYIAGVLFSNFQTLFVGDYWGNLYEIRRLLGNTDFSLIESAGFPSSVISGGAVIPAQGKFYYSSPRDTLLQEYDIPMEVAVENNNSPSWPNGRTGPGLKFVEYLETQELISSASLDVIVENPQAVSVAADSTTSVLNFTFPSRVYPGAIVTDAGVLAIVDSMVITETPVNECTDPLRGFESGSENGRIFEKAFDALNTDYTVDSFETEDVYGEQIVGYAFPSKIVIDRIEVSASNGTHPRGWVFEGSNDSIAGIDGAWTALHTSSIYAPEDWTDFETKTFDLANTTAYAMYRLNFTGWADFQPDVINIQTDDTLDPGSRPDFGDSYIITDSANLHANFGTITGLESGDIVRFSSTDGVLLAGDILADVIDVQTDATLDPGTTPTDGDRYIIGASTVLHANFGTIAGIGNGDIVEYNGTTSVFEIVFDNSAMFTGMIYAYVTALDTYYKKATVSAAWSSISTFFEVFFDASAATLPYAYAYVSIPDAQYEWDSTSWSVHSGSMSVNVGEIKMMGPNGTYKHSVTLTQALTAVPAEAYMTADMFVGPNLVTGMVEVGVDSISDFTTGKQVSFKQISETANLEPTQKVTVGVKNPADGATVVRAMTIHAYLS